MNEPIKTSLMMSGSNLVCPLGKSGLGSPGSIVVDLTAIVMAEHRLIEVQRVTPARAQELQAFFAEAWRKTREIHGAITYEKGMAERRAEKIRGVLILDHVPETLKKKGLATEKNPAGSEDLRKAVLATCTEYQGALDTVDYLEAAAEYLKSKVESFKTAYFDIKEARREASGLPNRSFNGGNQDELEPGMEPPRTMTRSAEVPRTPERARTGRAGFGTPEY